MSQRPPPHLQRAEDAGVQAAHPALQVHAGVRPHGAGADLAFHRRIAEAPGNDLLADIGNMLSLALRESIQLSSKLPNIRVA